MPGVADIALIIFKYQLVVVQFQVVFGWETVCIFAAPAHPQAGNRIRINPFISFAGIMVFTPVLLFGLTMAIKLWDGVCVYEVVLVANILVMCWENIILVRTKLISRDGKSEGLWGLMFNQGQGRHIRHDLDSFVS